MVENSVVTIVWKVRDGSDGPWMKQQGGWTTAQHLVGEWNSPEDAARTLLNVDADHFQRAAFVEETRTAVQAMRVSEMLPPPSTQGVVPAAWLAVTGSWNPKLLLNTKRLVDARNIDPMDIPAVVDAFNQVSGRIPFHR